MGVFLPVRSLNLQLYNEVPRLPKYNPVAAAVHGF